MIQRRNNKPKGKSHIYTNWSQIKKHKKMRMIKKKNLFVDVAQEVDFISQRSHLILQICLHQVGRVYILNTHPRKQTPLHSLNEAREFIITPAALLG